MLIQAVGQIAGGVSECGLLWRGFAEMWAGNTPFAQVRISCPPCY